MIIILIDCAVGVRVRVCSGDELVALRRQVVGNQITMAIAFARAALTEGGSDAGGFLRLVA